MKLALTVCATSSLWALCLCCFLHAAELPNTIPDSLGVNIHFTGAPAKDLDMIQAAGFRFIRMDFTWQGIEKEKGKYGFEPYDQLTDTLQQRGIRALYILDYSNPLYEKERSVQTDEGRAAFARFAAAAAERYKGRGVIWELWNEPNIFFWQPQPSTDAYMALAKAVFPAMRAADPNAFLVAPATSQIPLDFLEGCFKQGLLDLVDAVTVHPYRKNPPETVADDYLRLRALIAKYRPDRPDLPVISGEWGYSVVWPGMDAQRQGMYLPREFLTNLSLGIPISIWYDWHDDGPKPDDPEHHFGTVTLDYHPKSSYLAMQRLVKELGGMRFVKRLESDSRDYLMLFSDGAQSKIAAWTLGDAKEAEPVPGRKTMLTQEPAYLPVPGDAKTVQAEGAWTLHVRCVGVKAGTPPGEPLTPEFELRVRNPFAEKIHAEFEVLPVVGLNGQFDRAPGIDLEPGKSAVLHWRGQAFRRDVEKLSVAVEANVPGFRSRQTVSFIVLNPVSVIISVLYGRSMKPLLRGADGFDGSLDIIAADQTLSYSFKVRGNSAMALPLAGGQPLLSAPYGDDLLLHLPREIERSGDPIRIVLRTGDQIVADSGTLTVQPLSRETRRLKAINDGDPNVQGKFTLRELDRLAKLGGEGFRLTYECAEGWKFVRVAPPADVPVDGKPHEIGVWVNGDGSGNLLRMRFRDANDRYFQPDFGMLDFTGWRFLTAPLDSPNVGTWDGKPGVTDIVYPIRINTVILLDARRSKTQGEIDFGNFTLIYQLDENEEQQ